MERTSVDWVRRCMSTAMTSARMVCRPMLMTTYSRVTHTAFQKILSWTMRE